jgi:hypothetical protein
VQADRPPVARASAGTGSTQLPHPAPQVWSAEDSGTADDKGPAGLTLRCHLSAPLPPPRALLPRLFENEASREQLLRLLEALGKNTSVTHLQ